MADVLSGIEILPKFQSPE